MHPAVPLIFLAFSSSAQAVPPPDTAAILAPVIANQARIYGAKPVPCVRSGFEGVAFDDQRRMAAHAAGGDGGVPAPGYRWTVPSTRGTEGTTQATLPPDEARTLSEAAADIIRAPGQARAVGRIEKGWLPRPLQLCGDERQRPFLTFSAPSVQGDVAFVESGFVCEGLCGNGLLYALRRTGSKWRIVSVVFTWVS